MATSPSPTAGTDSTALRTLVRVAPASNVARALVQHLRTQSDIVKQEEWAELLLGLLQRADIRLCPTNDVTTAILHILQFLCIHGMLTPRIAIAMKAHDCIPVRSLYGTAVNMVMKTALAVCRDMDMGKQFYRALKTADANLYARCNLAHLVTMTSNCDFLQWYMQEEYAQIILALICTDDKGFTALHCTRSAEVAKLLLDEGADVNRTAVYSSETPIEAFFYDLGQSGRDIMEHEKEYIDVLVNHGAMLAQANGNTVLHSFINGFVATAVPAEARNTVLNLNSLRSLIAWLDDHSSIMMRQIMAQPSVATANDQFLSLRDILVGYSINLLGDATLIEKFQPFLNMQRFRLPQASDDSSTLMTDDDSEEEYIPLDDDSEFPEASTACIPHIQLQYFQPQGSGETKEDHGDNEECCNCMANPVDTVFHPCGHHVVCSACAPLFRACPQCDGASTMSVDISAVVTHAHKRRRIL